MGFLLLGMLILAAIWLGPLPRLAQHAFFAHMLMHMGVVVIAAPLIAFGAAVRWAETLRRFPRLLSPVPASLVEFAVVWGWHAPALHHAARQEAPALAAEQGTFLLSGIFLWISAFGGRQSGDGDWTAAGVIALLLTSMHMTLLGALLALAPRTLYAHAQGFAGLTALEDQHLGGAIMLLAGGISYLAGGLWLTAGLLRMRIQQRGEQA